MKTNIEILESIAPTLAAALKGSFVNVATKFIIDRLTGGEVDKTKSTDDIIADLLNDTKNLKKIKVFDEQFKLEMKELGVNVFAHKKTNNRNAMEMEKTNILPQIIISILFLVAYFVSFGAIFYVEISDALNMKQGENSLRGGIQILFGVITAGVGQIFGFWFSSSPKKILSSESQPKINK